ncbi:hypothetical protein FHG87_004859 [Trinorchestia longiramus]|nr:hypothetical protein FHG87_004859 [Trinorchestia longiramus]
MITSPAGPDEVQPTCFLLSFQQQFTLIIKTSSSNRLDGGGCGGGGECQRNSRALHNTTSTSAASSFQNFPTSPSSCTSQSVVDYSSSGWPRLPPVSHEFGSKQHNRNNKHGNSHNNSGRRSRGGAGRSKESDNIDAFKTHLNKRDKAYGKEESYVDNCRHADNLFRNDEGFDNKAKDSRGQMQAEFVENSFGGNAISRNYEHYSAFNEERARLNDCDGEDYQRNSASPISAIDFTDHGPERPKNDLYMPAVVDRRMDVSETRRDTPHQADRIDKDSTKLVTGVGLTPESCMEPKVGVAAGTEIDFHVLAAYCGMMKQQEYQMHQQHYSNHLIQQHAQRDSLEHLFNLEQQHKMETQQRLQHQQHFLYGIEAFERQRLQAHDQSQHQYNEEHRNFLQHLESERRAFLAIQQRNNFTASCVQQLNQNRPVFQQNGYNLEPLTSLIPNFMSSNSLPELGISRGTTERASPAAEHNAIKPSSSRGQISCVSDTKFVGSSTPLPVPASSTNNDAVYSADKHNKNCERHKCDANLIGDSVNLDNAADEPFKGRGTTKASKKQRKRVESSSSQFQVKDISIQNGNLNENLPHSRNDSLKETNVPIDILFNKMDIASKAASLASGSLSDVNIERKEEMHPCGSEDVSKKLENIIGRCSNEDQETGLTDAKSINNSQRMEVISKDFREMPVDNNNNKTPNVKGNHVSSTIHGRNSVLNHLLNSRFTLVSAPRMAKNDAEEPDDDFSSVSVKKTHVEQPCSNSKQLIVPSCVAFVKTSDKEPARLSKESVKSTQRKSRGRSKSPTKINTSIQPISESSSAENLTRDRNKKIYKMDERAKQFTDVNNSKEQNPSISKVSSTPSNVPANMFKGVTSQATPSGSLPSNSAGESQFFQTSLKSLDSLPLIRQLNSPNHFFHQGMMSDGGVYPATSHHSSLPMVSAHHSIPTMLPNNYANPLPQQALPGVGIRFPVYSLPVGAHQNFHPSQPTFLSAPFPPMGVPPFHPYPVDPQCSIPTPPYPPNAAYSFAASSQYAAPVPFSAASILHPPMMSKEPGNGRILNELPTQISKLFIDGVRNSNDCLSETSSLKHSTCSKNKKSSNHTSCKHKSSETRHDRDRHAKESDSTMSSASLRSARKSHKHQPTSYSKSHTDGSNGNTDSSSTCSVKTHPRAGKTLRDAVNDLSLTPRPSHLFVDDVSSVSRLSVQETSNRCKNDEKAALVACSSISCDSTMIPVTCSNYASHVPTASRGVASQHLPSMSAVQSVCAISSQVTVSTAIFRNMNSICAITPPTSPSKNNAVTIAFSKDDLKPLGDGSNPVSSKRKHHKHSHSSQNRQKDDCRHSSNSRSYSPCDARQTKESTSNTENANKDKRGTTTAIASTQQNIPEHATPLRSEPTNSYGLSNRVSSSMTSTPLTVPNSISNTTITTPQLTGILIPSLPPFRDPIAPSKKSKTVEEKQFEEHSTSVPVVDRRKTSTVVPSSKRKKDRYEPLSSPTSTPAPGPNVVADVVNVGVASRRTHKPPQLVLARQRLSSIELPDVITPDTPNVPTGMPKFRLVLK